MQRTRDSYNKLHWRHHLDRLTTVIGTCWVTQGGVGNRCFILCDTGGYDGSEQEIVR